MGYAVDQDAEYTKEHFFRDLQLMRERGQLKGFIESVQKAMDAKKVLDAPMKIKDVNKRTAMHQLVEHLKVLGVKVEELSRT